MLIRTVVAIVAGLAMLSGASFAQAMKPDDNQAAREKGKQIYERSCLLCHGGEGKGDGPAGWFLGRYSSPRPRDFTLGEYKLRTTASGEAPTDQDLFRTLTRGIPGFMPSFAGLSAEDRWAVIAYIKSLSDVFHQETAQPISIGLPAIPPSPDSLETGGALYRSLECFVCHGSSGGGDGPLAEAGTLRDGAGLRIAATDLTNRASYKNGASPRDIYRTLVTGLDGTPMPSYAGQFAGKEAQLWHVVNYILSLSPEVRP
jgi:cytochrome c oxidase cbb3-type subunit 2